MGSRKASFFSLAKGLLGSCQSHDPVHEIVVYSYQEGRPEDIKVFFL